MSEELCSFCKQPKKLKTCAYCQRSMADYGPAVADEVKKPLIVNEPSDLPDLPDDVEDLPSVDEDTSFQE